MKRPKLTLLDFFIAIAIVALVLSWIHERKEIQRQNAVDSDVLLVIRRRTLCDPRSPPLYVNSHQAGRVLNDKLGSVSADSIGAIKILSCWVGAASEKNIDKTFVGSVIDYHNCYSPSDVIGKLKPSLAELEFLHQRPEELNPFVDVCLRKDE